MLASIIEHHDVLRVDRTDMHVSPLALTHAQRFMLSVLPGVVSENKPPSVVSVRMAFIDTLNLPTHFILTTLHSIYHLLVGQLLLLLLLYYYNFYYTHISIVKQST